MRLIRAGRKVINLEYLILSEEFDESHDAARFGPGDVRVTLEKGRTLSLREAEAHAFLEKLYAEVCPPDGGRRDHARARPCDPATGEPLDSGDARVETR